MTAKVLSWAAKIISVAFMILSFFFTDKAASDICIVGLTIMAVVGTIDISIWIDKIVGKSTTKLQNDTTDAVGQDIPHDPDAGDDDPEFPVEVPNKQRCGFRK
jgi:ABC-type uncharacterized transport system permease subunit